MTGTDVVVTQAPALGLFSLASRMLWVETWSPGDELPATATRRDLVALNQELNQAMRPAAPKVIAQAIAELMLGIEALGLKVGNERDDVSRMAAKRKLAEIYTDAVKGLPADLVAVACRRVLQADLRFRPPTAAQLSGTVSDELQRRSKMRAMAFLASREAPEVPRRPQTPEEREAAHAMVSQALAGITSRSVESPASAEDAMQQFLARAG